MSGSEEQGVHRTEGGPISVSTLVTLLQRTRERAFPAEGVALWSVRQAHDNELSELPNSAAPTKGNSTVVQGIE